MSFLGNRSVTRFVENSKVNIRAGMAGSSFSTGAVFCFLGIFIDYSSSFFHRDV